MQVRGSVNKSVAAEEPQADKNAYKYMGNVIINVMEPCTNVAAVESISANSCTVIHTHMRTHTHISKYIISHMIAMCACAVSLLAT